MKIACAQNHMEIVVSLSTHLDLTQDNFIFLKFANFGKLQVPFQAPLNVDPKFKNVMEYLAFQIFWKKVSLLVEGN